MRKKEELLKEFDEGRHGRATLEVYVDIRDILLRILAAVKENPRYEYPLYSEET